MLLSVPIKLFESGSKSSSPTVILHGLLGRSRNMNTIAKGLAHLTDVYCFDLRGHGVSEHAGELNVFEMAQDVVDTCKSLGLTRINLLAHSLGGKVAMCIALTSLSHEIEIESLIVVDMPPASSKRGNVELIDKLLSRTLPSFERSSQATSYIQEIVKDPGIAAWLAQNIAPGNPSRWTCDMLAIQKGLPATESWPLGDSHVAADAKWLGHSLFVYGEKSSYVGEDEKGRIKHYFPYAYTCMLKGAGHWLHAERPKEFLEIVVGFLQNR